MWWWSARHLMWQMQWNKLKEQLTWFEWPHLDTRVAKLIVPDSTGHGRKENALLDKRIQLYTAYEWMIYSGDARWSCTRPSSSSFSCVPLSLPLLLLFFTFTGWKNFLLKSTWLLLLFFLLLARWIWRIHLSVLRLAHDGDYHWRWTFTRILVCIKYIDWWQGDNSCSYLWMVIAFHSSEMTHIHPHALLNKCSRADCFWTLISFALSFGSAFSAASR